MTIIFGLEGMETPGIYLLIGLLAWNQARRKGIEKPAMLYYPETPRASALLVTTIQFIIDYCHLVVQESGLKSSIAQNSIGHLCP